MLRLPAARRVRRRRAAARARARATRRRNLERWRRARAPNNSSPRYVADALLGQYDVIVAFSAVYLAGTALLTLGVVVVGGGASPALTFFAPVYVVSVGSGCLKPLVSTFGADHSSSATEATTGRSCAATPTPTAATRPRRRARRRPRRARRAHVSPWI